EVIRIAFNSQNRLAYDESNLDPSFLDQIDRESLHLFKERGPNTPQLDIVAAIKAEDWHKSNQIKNGLGLLDQDQGATTWAVLSSPIEVNQTYLNFHNDTFARVVVDRKVES